MKEEGSGLKLDELLFEVLYEDENLINHPLQLKGILLDRSDKTDFRDVFLIIFLLQTGFVKKIKPTQYNLLFEQKIVRQLYQTYGFDMDLICRNVRIWAKTLYHLHRKTDTKETIHFADPNLEEAVKASIYKEKGASLTEGDLQSLSVLRGDHFQISNLSGIEKLTNVEHISLQYNEIIDITPLLFLKQLKTLFISHNKIEKMSVINEFDSIRAVDFSHNPINDLPKLSDRSLMLMFDTIGDDISIKAQVYTLLTERGYEVEIYEGGEVL